ncbi:MAG: flagellar export chaperone FlgN [Candidatus Pelagadaptatus aseana]|uniref:flagella synthesis protein FlgN n=1 Tax=Candidatus Pelagadaptatus aseana TaxID=3120508 RepID=UPI0039B21AD4
MSKTPNCREVQTLIAQDWQIAQQLQQLLCEEHQALTNRDQQAIDQLLADKQQLMQTLESSSATRRQWLQAQHPDLGNSQEQQTELWENFISQLGGPALLEQWQRFKKTISLCKQENEKNGKIIARSHQTVKQLLNIIRGQRVDAPRLYTAKGDTRVQHYSQSVIKA